MGGNLGEDLGSPGLRGPQQWSPPVRTSASTPELLTYALVGSFLPGSLAQESRSVYVGRSVLI